MQKLLFVDRDGTLVKEPEDYQVDALDKISFLPGVFRHLGDIARFLSYKLVMVTNQDGLGTDSFPEGDFWPAQNFILNTLKGEGIEFDEILVDKTFPYEQAPTRKPGTGLLKHYMDGKYDLEHSYVIGDRLSDIQLAKNLGAKAIWIKSDPRLSQEENQKIEDLKNTLALSADSWEEIRNFLFLGRRSAKVNRVTKETDISIELQLEGQGKSSIQTGIGFFDHMLDQLAKHSGSNLSVQVKGDLHIDEHHTIEDTALALGSAYAKAMQDKSGMERYGYSLPMDDCTATVSLDFGGRPWIIWDATFDREYIGKMPTEMFFHFFKSFSDAAACNLFIQAEGQNEHHKIEAIFKAFARAIKMAIQRNPFDHSLPSTKGVL